MKGKIFVSLFALPFFAVGVWMLWSIGSTLSDAWQMRDWVAVEARLIRGGYETNSGSDADTYTAFVEYTYSYGGSRYSGDRVAVASGGDNVGDYQQQTGRRLQAAVANEMPITVFVDPDVPEDSIVDRNVRWGLIGFKSIFLLVFGGVGLGLPIFAWRVASGRDAGLPEYRDAPWLANDKWQTPTIYSSSKNAMWGAWAFAAFWNLVSAPLPFLLYEEITRKENYIALIGLLFPLIGVGMLVWAIRRTLEWRRFGAAPVTLDPFPGSIGGHVGGTIDLNMPFDPSARFQLTLNNLHSYISGSGKNRSRREEAEWQDKLIAFAEPGARGTRLTFRFDIPDGLDASDTEHDDSYHKWQLDLSARLAGVDIDRIYEIPVYPTSTQSRHLADRAVQKARAEQDRVDEQSVGEVIRLKNTSYGKQLVYPMGRNIGPSLGGIMVGGMFAAAGWWLIVEEGQSVFGGIFGSVGLLVAVFCLYLMLNSLEVSKQAADIISVRRLFGIPIRRRTMRQDSFIGFKKKSTMKSQSGGKHTVYYAIYGLDRQDNEIVLGEGFRGENEARAAMRIIGNELGLRERVEPGLSRHMMGVESTAHYSS